MVEHLQDFVNKIETYQVPWLPYGLVEGCFFRVLKVDPDSNLVVLNFRMPPNCETQMHDHYCTALAYTLEGEWMYNDQTFRKGDLAFEVPGEVHQPVTGDQGAELLTILFGGKGNSLFLKNFEADGSSYNLGLKMLQAYERKTPEEVANLDIESLLE
jgi:quercetin dioxygenase-like cupin family protein